MIVNFSNRYRGKPRADLSLTVSLKDHVDRRPLGAACLNFVKGIHFSDGGTSSPAAWEYIALQLEASATRVPLRNE